MRHPMLAIVREHQRGSDAANPAVCPECGFRAWLSVDHVNERIKLQYLTSV
jgi:hypothetical protein